MTTKPSAPQSTTIEKRTKPKKACKLKQKITTRDRLLSIIHDSETFVVPTVQRFQRLSYQTSHGDHNNWKVFGNERCGAWYSRNPQITNGVVGCDSGNTTTTNNHTCRFKSTDGHPNEWTFSSRRLNLPFLRNVGRDGGAIVVDASRRRCIPDAFSRTLPIWCAVINRLLQLPSSFSSGSGDNNHNGRNDDNDDEDSNDLGPHLPSCVSPREAKEIRSIIPKLVFEADKEGVLLDRESLTQLLGRRPLRCFWVRRGDDGSSNGEDGLLENVLRDVEYNMNKFACVVCISCSRVDKNDDGGCGEERVKNQSPSMYSGLYANEELFTYIPGAGDDEEGWSMGLVPSLFWSRRKEIVQFGGEGGSSNDHVVSGIARVIGKESRKARNDVIGICEDLGREEVQSSSFDIVAHHRGKNALFGKGSLSIGTRRAGRPPNCWENFDAIVNVTEDQYAGMDDGSRIPSGKFYLQIPVAEGKRDRSGLEQYLSVALAFVMEQGVHREGNVLVHCAQGRDRSVGVAMAIVCLFCTLERGEVNQDVFGTLSGGTLGFQPSRSGMTLVGLENFVAGENGSPERYESSDSCKDGEYSRSGIPKWLHRALLGRNGRDLFLTWLAGVNIYSDAVTDNHGKDNIPILATKASLRRSQIIIQQYREIACPSRRTLQKLHRYFMSSGHEIS